MMMKRLFALSHVLVGSGAAYTFLASDKKPMDLMWLCMALMIVFEGFRMLLEDQHAAAAQIFARIRNAGFILAIGAGVWLLLRQA